MIFDRSKAIAAHGGAAVVSKLGALMLAVVLCLGCTPGIAFAETKSLTEGTQTVSTAVETEDAGSESAPASTGQSAATSLGAVSAEEAETLAEKVSATLMIGVHDATGTKMLVNKKHLVDEGSSVEQMLDQAVADGDIDSYTHGEAYPGYTSYYVSSITVGGVAYAQSATFDPYWSSRIDGGDDFTGINETKVTHEGFSYQLTLTYSSADAGATVIPDPDTSHEDMDAAWSGDPQTPAGNVSSATATPKTPDTAELFWKNNLLAEGETYACISDPLIIDGKIYIAYGPWGSLAKLSVFNATTGALEKTTPLAAAIESATCRPVYADGIIVIPLVKGQLQGISAESLTTMWMSPMVSDKSQAVSGLTVVNGRVYTGTADTLNSDYSPIATSGHFMCVDLNNGQVLWSKANASSGYYWSGATLIGSSLVFGDDAGTLASIDPVTGDTLSTLSLGSASIRSTVITDSSNTVGYVVSADGVLHKIAVDAAGRLSQTASVSFASASSSTATLFEGKLYVGGMSADYKGVLAVIDANSLAIDHMITVPYEVKSTPSVARGADGAIYTYFTCNGAAGAWPDYTSGGGVYVYKLGDSAASLLYDCSGSDANWCTKSVVIGPDGTLYWSNDSGNLFAVGEKPVDPVGPVDPVDPSNPDLTQASAKTNTSTLAQTGDSVPVSPAGSVALVAFLGAAVCYARIRSLKNSR